MSEITGVFQPDVIIRSAIIRGLNDLRANPWLLDYAFASLAQDSLTEADYGSAEVERAKDWFRKTDIKVYLNLNINEVQFPSVSLTLMSSAEEENTHSDTHYAPSEDAEPDWPPLTGLLTPVSYDPVTGTIVFDSEQTGGLIMAPGMVVLTKTGGKYPVLQVTEPLTTVLIKAGTQVDLEDCRLMPASPAYVVDVESANFKETYGIGCHVDSEPIHLIYLHSIVVFILLRYRQDLLEARGFERSSVSSADLRLDQQALPEFFYDRYVTLSGYVRQSWPKAMNRRVTSVFAHVAPDEVMKDAEQKALLEALELDALAKFKLT